MFWKDFTINIHKKISFSMAYGLFHFLHCNDVIFSKRWGYGASTWLNEIKPPKLLHPSSCLLQWISSNDSMSSFTGYNVDSKLGVHIPQFSWTNSSVFPSLKSAESFLPCWVVIQKIWFQMVLETLLTLFTIENQVSCHDISFNDLLDK